MEKLITHFLKPAEMDGSALRGDSDLLILYFGKINQPYLKPAEMDGGALRGDEALSILDFSKNNHTHHFKEMVSP